MQQRHVAGLRDQFPGAVTIPVPLLAHDVVGVAAVEALGAHLPAVDTVTVHEAFSTTRRRQGDG
jgi:D-aminopeptidase